MIDRSRCPLLLALLACWITAAPSSAEEEYTAVPFFKSVNGYDLVAMGHPGSQGRVVHGDVTGDLTGAMLFQLNDQVYWSPLPYSLTSMAPLVEPALDAVDLVMARASAGDRDIAVLSTDSGLSAALFKDQVGDFVVSGIPGTGVWTDATQLRRHPPGNSGRTVVSGVLPDGATVRVSEIDELGETLLFSLTIPVPILDHDLIDYNGDGSLEVAFVTTLGLYVFNQSGLLLRREQLDLTAGGTANFTSSDGDRLAFWFQDAATGLAHLRVIDGPATEANQQLAFLPPGSPLAIDVLPKFMSVGDYNDDGSEDLLLQLHRQFCVLLTNLDDGSGVPALHFSVTEGDYDSIALSANPLGLTDPGDGRAFFGNIDSDPGDDMIVPIDELDRIELFTREGELNPKASPPPGQESFVGLDFDDLVTANSTYWWDAAGVAHFNLALDVPAEYMPGQPKGFEYLQVLAWFQNGLSQQLQPVAEQNTLYTLDSATEFQWVPVVPQEQGALLTGDFWPERDNMWVVLRFVDADLTTMPPTIERASRFAIGAFTLRDQPTGTTIPPYLSGLSGAGGEIGLLQYEEPLPSDPALTFGGSGGWGGPKQRFLLPNLGAPVGVNSPGGGIYQGGGYIGAYVPQSSSTLFPPGDVPFFPSASHGGGMGIY